MKIALINANPGRHVGYGEVSYNMIKTLQELNHSIVPYKEADIKIWMCWPRRNRFYDPGYHIAYLPWESTELQPGWKSMLNAHDEVWTPSPIIAQWFEDYGVHAPVHVYGHGVGKEFTGNWRRKNGPIKFFHHGGDALRKGGQQCVQAFNAAFPNDPDVTLTMKMYSQGWNIPSLGRVSIINQTIDLSDLVQMYHDHDVMVCNSWGEGFGLPALQGMATGMPLICTEAWAPYAEDIQIAISAELIDSPWPEYHPGKLWKPNFDELVDAMRYAKDNFEELSWQARHMGGYYRRKYSWKSQTIPVFNALEERYKNSSKYLAR